MEMRNEEIMREEIKHIISVYSDILYTEKKYSNTSIENVVNEIMEVIKEEEKPNCPTMEEAEASGNHECQECLEYNYKKC